MGLLACNPDPAQTEKSCAQIPHGTTGEIIGACMATRT